MSATDWGKAIAKAALAIENIVRGPWKGAVESKTPDQVPGEYAAGTGSHDFLYLPRTGTWKRRGGQVIMFDTASPDPIEPGGEGYGSSYGTYYGGS